MKKLIIPALISGIVSISASAYAADTDYPNKPIDLVVPFDPGGSVDTTSRIIAEVANSYLSDNAKISIVNRSGGGGVIGQTSVALAKPDGYSILAMTSSVVTNPQMKGARYVIDDFEPVALYNLDPQVIAVPGNSPFKTAEEFLAAAEQKKLNIVIAGIGTSHHMSGLAIEKVTNSKFNYIPTKGFGSQVQAVVGGHVDGVLWPLGEAISQLTDDRIRILAIASEERSERYPDIPTFQEVGINIPIWATFRGWAVPKGTPKETIEHLSALMKRVYETPSYVEKMKSSGYLATYRDSAGFKSVVDNYSKLTTVIIEEGGFGIKK